MITEYLNLEEQEIFDITKEFIKKQSIVRIIELVSFIDNRLKYNPNFNKNKIEKIVKSLIKKKIILIGTRLTKDDILRIQIRKEIYEYIKENPGININEIKNAFNLGSNQVLWHLRMLKDFNFIRDVKIRNQKALFDIRFDESHDYLIFYLRNEKIRDIINLLKTSNEPLKPTVISESLNSHYNTVKKYLEVLLRLNIIIKVNGNKKKSYELNHSVYQNLLKFL